MLSLPSPAALGRPPRVRRLALLLLSGLLATCTIPAGAGPKSAPSSRPDGDVPFAAHVAAAAQRFDIPAAWIRAVMHVESDGEVRVISPKGAIGLMQIMPATWAELRVRYRLGSDPFDPRDNILAGAAYLRELLDRYGSPGLLAAYNAGPARYEAYLAGEPLPAETRAYVATLAPIFGGGAFPSQAARSASDPRAWTGAPLFVAPPRPASGAVPVPADRRGSPATDAASERDLAGMAPQPRDLFVPPSDAGGLR